jgi:hypothetical protein
MWKRGDSLLGCCERGKNILVPLRGGKFPDQLGHSDVISVLISGAQLRALCRIYGVLHVTSIVRFPPDDGLLIIFSIN